MIFVNRKEIDFTSFPDGTTSFRYDPSEHSNYEIEWRYDGDHECILLWQLVNHIRDRRNRCALIELVMPYIPNARMDRVKNDDEVFTLKWFASFINMMKFDTVTVFDPHSNVSVGLIDRVRVVDAGKTVESIMAHNIRETLGKQDVLLCYPDEGAAKRYSAQIHGEYVFGIKHRDWRTGKIQKLELVGAEKVKGKSVLIVDDICSRGGTFTHMAQALQEAGAESVFLYVTHCENTIREGSVLTDGLITRVYTTNSIFRGDHEKVTVMADLC